MEENNYLPLFRKYRPQSFKDVIGQKFTVKALQNAIKLNKIANAYLFCGSRGTGKTSLARIFAKSLNCEKGPTVTPCQKCRSCLDVTNATGIDVIEIDAATNRGIDDAKELISKVQYAPMSGKYKIFIIDEVHMLSKEAFNALLKTFEEPPKNVIFILATTEPHKVIETIVSRCQRFDFRRITIDDIVERLEEISKLENIKITKEALYAIAKNVSGGMRDSLALLDQSSVLGVEKEITKEDIELLIGKITFDTLYKLLVKILSNDIQGVIEDINNIYAKGSEPRNFVENFVEFLRNVILILNSKDDETSYAITLIEKDNIKKIKENKNFNSQKIVSILDNVIEFYKEIKVSTNPYLWVELCLISISAEKEVYAKEKTQTVNIHEIQKKSAIQENKPIQKEPEKIIPKAEENIRPKIVEKVEEKQEIKEELKENKTDKQPEINTNTEVVKQIPSKQNNVSPSDNPVTIWTDILNRIDSVPAKFFYSGLGKLVSIKDNQIILGFVNQNAITQAKSENKYNPLLKAIKSVLGESSTIEFITVTEDTKIISTKLTAKISTENNQTQSIKAQPAMQPSIQTNSHTREDNFEQKESRNFNNTDEEKPDTTGCTKAVTEMLQTFGGRFIEQ